MDARRSAYSAAALADSANGPHPSAHLNADPHQILTPFLLGERLLQARQAEEAVLSWLVLLGDDVDPALAAARMGDLPDPVENEGAARLRVLLKQISEYSAAKRPQARRRRARTDA